MPAESTVDVDARPPPARWANTAAAAGERQMLPRHTKQIRTAVQDGTPATVSPTADVRSWTSMNGAEAMIRTLVDAGVTTCFTNPGTSEMHFVAALDTVPGMRGVLGLFEGVVTGAADGYARMAERPAATLLHLGPGLGNGLANLHNARRAATPVVNIVGDHATYHARFDAPLHSDIDAAARNVSGWIGRPERTGRAVPGHRRGRRRGAPARPARWPR